MAPKDESSSSEEPKHSTKHGKETSSSDSEPTSSHKASPTDSSTIDATTSSSAAAKTHSTSVLSTTFTTLPVTSTTTSSFSTITAASQTAASTSTPTGVNTSSSSHTAAVAGIVVFGIFAALAVSCFAGFFIKRRRDQKKVAIFGKRPSYNPFRSASYSSAHIPLTSDHGNPQYNPHGAAAQTHDDDKSSMFSRTRSTSTLSVYTVVPESEQHHEDEYSTRRLSSSLVPVTIAGGENHGRSRDALSPDDVTPPPPPNISVTRPSVEEWQIGIPQHAVSPVSPTDTRTGRERSRSSVSLNRFYDPSAVARAM